MWILAANIAGKISFRDWSIGSRWLRRRPIISGDGNFTSLVAALQRKGCESRRVDHVDAAAKISDELRRQAGYFIDLVNLRSEIDREHSENTTNPDS
ncbi:NYN domain-containing protein [Sinorhizobium meliloti]|uniref:NYN domain-containing protein n=1 Tax=Rhizobium meliloti TaxID=382 RepID=UPI003B520D84